MKAMCAYRLYFSGVTAGGGAESKNPEVTADSGQLLNLG